MDLNASEWFVVVSAALFGLSFIVVSRRSR